MAVIDDDPDIVKVNMMIPSREDTRPLPPTVVRKGVGLDPGTAGASCTCTFKSIEDLQPGDHFCCLYDTEEEHRELMTPFLKTGLEKGEKVVYIVDARTAETVLGYLRDSGVEVEPYLSSGQLSILSVDEAYMASGEFDPDGMIGMLTDETEKALAEGYGALRVTGEMSWALRGLPGSERLMEYEAKLNRFFPGSKCLAICQYDRRIFESSVLLNVLSTHPFAVLGTELFDNFHYMPPDEFLAGEPQRATLDHWVSSLRKHKATEEALRQSEEHYRLLVESASDVILTTDLDLIVTYASPSVERQTGFTVEEVIGHDAREFITAESLDGIAEELADQLARQCETDVTPPVPVIIEVEQCRKDGSTYPVEVNAGFLRDPDGTPYGIIVVSRNITERKAAEEALRESEARFRQLADNLPEVIFEADRLGRFVYVNSNARKVFGYTEEELYSGPVGVLEMISEEYREQAVQRIQMILSEGAQGSNEYMARRKDGSTFPSIISALPIVKGDMTVGVRGVLTDITAQKEVEEALHRVNEELEGYTRTVSHDLKSPLSAIALSAEALSAILEGEGGEGAGGFTGEALRIIRENTARAVALISDLLALAEAGQASVKDQPVDVSEVVGSVLEENETLLKDHGVRVSLEGDLGVAAMDTTHAYQLFANLVGNAIKHSGSKNPEIDISSLGETEPGRLRYLVRDNGQGIPEQLLETLFTPFVKGERGGTGIGLSIVDKVVRLYGGEIRAFNDNGACFEFTLPMHSSWELCARRNGPRRLRARVP